MTGVQTCALPISVPVLPDLVRATTEDLIHHRLEGSAVRALTQPPLVHDPLGVRVRAVHDLKDLTGLGEADRIGREQTRDRRGLRRRDVAKGGQQVDDHVRDRGGDLLPRRRDGLLEEGCHGRVARDLGGIIAPQAKARLVTLASRVRQLRDALARLLYELVREVEGRKVWVGEQRREIGRASCRERV